LLKVKGSLMRFLITGAGAILGFVILVFFVFGQVVGPNEIGIRQNYFSLLGLLDKGYQNEGLEPGLHWKIPSISTVIIIRRDFQLVHLSDRDEPGDLSAGELEVPTRDGSKVKTDVTLVMRLLDRPGEGLDPKEIVIEKGEDGEEIVPFAERFLFKHGGPKQLIENFKDDPALQRERFRQIAESELKKSLSELYTTDYYDPALREAAALDATKNTNSAVNPYGIELWGALIRRYNYSEQNIDDQIFAKNLQEATERLNAEKSKLAEAQAETEKERALWDAKIKVLSEQGDTKAQVTRSEANLYEQQKRAEGNLLVSSAESEVSKQKATVLNEVSGADVYIASEIAPLLATLQGGVVSNIDPFDINGWIKKLIVGGNE